MLQFRSTRVRRIGVSAAKRLFSTHGAETTESVHPPLFTETACFIHDTAVVSKNASIAPGVRIGPYCVVGSEVVLESNVELKSHVVVCGQTTVGANSTLYSFSCVGERPQDRKFRDGEASEILIGQKTEIREYATVHPGTKLGGGKTIVGDNCLLMVGAHVGHDCRLGNNVILANQASLAGHVAIHDDAIIGGQSGIRQFVTIGRKAMIGGMSAVDADVIPFGLVIGNRAKVAGVNLVGLRRSKVPTKSIKAVLSAYRYVMLPAKCGTPFARPFELPSHCTIEERAEALLAAVEDPLAREMALFILDTDTRKRKSLCVAK